MQNLVAGCIVILVFPLALYCYFAFRVLRWGSWPTAIGGAVLISLCVAARSFYETLPILYTVFAVSPIEAIFGALFEAIVDALFGFPFYLAIMAVVSWATKTVWFKEDKETEA